ncbi:hypothetical protein LOK49_LG12G02977 [Camellia lanceoleosa]|uniref:Uncharacterized protein n=1 Tax=Camellia lanceoleosa TaxID=1840588 RepID=A0ACC0FYH4_9ERIC|nr:hypothetical protein LOK49_LG12G02977 [Camellia lanceoleosa]
MVFGAPPAALENLEDRMPPTPGRTHNRIKSPRRTASSRWNNVGKGGRQNGSVTSGKGLALRVAAGESGSPCADQGTYWERLLAGPSPGSEQSTQNCALNVKVKKFNQARVNGGSNYDSLKGKGKGKATGKAKATGNAKATGKAKAKAKATGRDKAKAEATGKAKAKATGKGKGKAKATGTGKPKAKATGGATGKAKAMGKAKGKGNATGKDKAKATGDGQSQGHGQGHGQGEGRGQGPAPRPWHATASVVFFNMILLYSYLNHDTQLKMHYN